MNLRTKIPAMAVLLGLVCHGAVAHADGDVARAVERLNRKAMEDYDSLEFDSARQTLLAAVAKLRDAGLDETELAAKCYINLGIVYISGFKDRNRGVQQFVAALKINSALQLEPERSTPELEEAFSAAKQQTSSQAPKRPKRAPASVHGLQHEVVDEATTGTDIPIHAVLGRDVSAARVFLFYRGTEESFTSVPMSAGDGGEWSATIPGKAVTGRAIQYYLEARDGRGRPITAAGSATSPFIISVLEAEQSAPNEPEKPEPTGARNYSRLFANLFVGIAEQLVPSGNQTEVAYELKDCGMGCAATYQPLTVGTTGFAFSPLHFSLEFGVQLTERISLSAMGRIGFTLYNNAETSSQATTGKITYKTGNDGMGMVRARYLFGEGRLRPFVHVGVGAGQLRGVIDVSHAQKPGQPLLDQDQAGKTAGAADMTHTVCPSDGSACYDTTMIGMMLASAGGGLFVELVPFGPHNGGFGLLVDLDAIFGIPVGDGGQFGINFDVNLGVGVHFL